MNEITRYDAIYSLVGGPLSGLLDGTKMKYLGGQTPPSEAEIDAEVARLEKEHPEFGSDNEYVRNRRKEYPSIEELVVGLYDTDDKADIEAKRAEVKKKYPKPS